MLQRETQKPNIYLIERVWTTIGTSTYRERINLWMVINTLVISIIVYFTRGVYLCIRNITKIICGIFV